LGELRTEEREMAQHVRTGYRRHRKATWGVLVGVLAVLASIGIGAGSAATGTKPYSATIVPSPVSPSSEVSLTFTLTNLASPQSIGSANLTAPDGFTIAEAHVEGTGDTGDTEFPTRLLKLRNLAVMPTDTRTVSLTVETPCTTGDYTWGLRAKQSNNFSGPPGNDFTNPPVGGFPVTTLDGSGPPNSVTFSRQPGSGQVATAGNPTAAVTVYDACGSVATSATGDVTVALVPPADPTFGGGTAVLGGTKSVPLSNGVASFTDLQVSESAQGYALNATYGSTTIGSETFDIFNFYGDCASGCGTSDDTTSITIGGTSGTFGLSLTSESGATCNGLQVVGESSAFTVVPAPGHSKADIPFSLIINKRGLQGVGVANIVVCKNSGPGTDLVQLGKCPKKGLSNTACIVSQTSSHAGDAVIKMLLTSEDPGGAGFS
jgi:hypothetical protein